jgi:O-antigen ligase
MTGALGGVFENPNDLAINIAINWPLCFAFFLSTDKVWKKLFWAGAMLIMVMGVVLTYSRSGFLALGLCAVISLYQFGLKGKRVYLIGLAIFAIVFLIPAAPIFGLYPKIWMTRMESTVLGNIDHSFDKGSKEARTELFKISMTEMATHPFTGVGPGNFAIFGDWHVAHNTYSEIGAEAGVPALLLFLAILARAFWNLRRTAKSSEYKRNSDLRLFTGAMVASLGAYLVGAAFSSTQYELFPYFMVAYTTVLYHMACVFPSTAKPENQLETGVQRDDRTLPRVRQAAWLR